ncbi:PilZ domain-containing protein [Pseudooctadecabacter jejudonensis]|uniref:PilZ domain protein n=1 Tax=Pseudooctadecabacter jejudonensis TaxID=1391910 RepID=A0A1Y5RP53_9RHOB|nr:PilZ domain-containing protein [Pseudooctadecabacter jejudonensis]SLN22116.1 PilZ domain protein [Pseudooctadecabacter jejudonensis]
MSGRAPRFPANFDVVLRKGPEMYPSTICNISVGGACLIGVDDFSKGETMTVDYAFGQTRATVTWKTGKMAGVKFDDKLSDSGLQFIRASQSYAS